MNEKCVAYVCPKAHVAFFFFGVLFIILFFFFFIIIYIIKLLLSEGYFFFIIIIIIAPVGDCVVRRSDNCCESVGHSPKHNGKKPVIPHSKPKQP